MTHVQADGQGRPGFPIVLKPRIIGGRAEILRIIETGLDAERRQAGQQVAEAAAGNNAEERQGSAREIVQRAGEDDMADLAADLEGVRPCGVERLSVN